MRETPEHGILGDHPRERVLLVAEQLLAEHGIEAVSLRRIARLAGQGNHSVVQYYFGTKLGLIKGIIDLHADSIETHRRQLLTQLRDAASIHLEDCLRAFVEPYAAMITEAGRTWYLRFLANAMDYSQMHAEWSFAPEATEALREVQELMRQQVPQIPEDLFARRSRVVALIVFRMLAGFESDLANGKTSITQREQVSHDAITACAALLRASVY